jgi:isocitrate dehydrogenase (NAD+)
MRQVGFVPGDGIGPEVTSAARQVLDATGVTLDWIEGEAGEIPAGTHGDPLPSETLEMVSRVGLVLKGPMANPIGRGYDSPNIGLRAAAGLFANVRVAQSFEGAPTPFPGVDIVVIRELTEDIYNGARQMVGPDAAIAIKFVTRAAVERIARFAFEYAIQNGRRRITVAHKAATLKPTDGLFLDTVRGVAKDYPAVECDDHLIDALAMHLVRDPRQFDILLAPFQYGDILADLCAGIVGGLGLVPGASFGANAAFFEAAHGSAPKYAGLDKVNPTALILSGALLLDHIGETAAADKVRAATRAVIAEGKATTYDLGGSAGTSAMTSAIAERVGA